MTSATIRELSDHMVNPANDTLRICTTDAPGAGGAHHRYVVTGYDLNSNKSVENGDVHAYGLGSVVLFQNGPIAEVGVNGVTHEALLAILCDRLRAFQTGPYACRENALALTKLEEAQHWLHHRTLARMRRGVEGTNKE